MYIHVHFLIYNEAGTSKLIYYPNFIILIFLDSPDFFLDLKKHPILIASGANGFGGLTS